MHITYALGGVQTYLEYLLSYTDSRQFEHIIAAPRREDFEQFCLQRAKYYPLRAKREVNPASDLFILIRLIRIIRRERPDILHVHSAKGGFIGRLAGKFFRSKVVYTPHGFSYLSFTGIKRMFFFGLECMSRQWSDVLAAVSFSESNRAVFEIGYDARKIKVILNSVSVTEETTERDFDSNYRIGTIGRLTKQKNPMLFLSIAKRLLKDYPHLQFSILGAGLNDHLGPRLNDFISSNNLQAKVQILPWGNADTSREFISRTDIFVMTSVFEGLPYSLLEAMNAECPCVVSKADGNSDVIQNNENGFSCIDENEFCKSIGLLINDRDQREKAGKAARAYIREKHDVAQAVQQLESIYSRLTETDTDRV